VEQDKENKDALEDDFYEFFMHMLLRFWSLCKYFLKDLLITKKFILYRKKNFVFDFFIKIACSKMLYAFKFGSIHFDASIFDDETFFLIKCPNRSLKLLNHGKMFGVSLFSVGKVSQTSRTHSFM
jgi:hypothetical protein